MSFHGGLLGVIVAMAIYARNNRIGLLRVTDFVAPLVPAGLLFGRLGNFIGQELWGRPTDLPWGMLFPNDPAQLPRHPSQLYEAFLEGLILFLLLNWFASRQRGQGEVSGLFLLLYGSFRFLVEFVRQPDAQFAKSTALVESLSWMTRGQWLCVPMILFGLYLLRLSILRCAKRPFRSASADI